MHGKLLVDKPSNLSGEPAITGDNEHCYGSENPGFNCGSVGGDMKGSGRKSVSA